MKKYKCTHCGHKFEARPKAESDTTICPSCYAGAEIEGDRMVEDLKQKLDKRDSGCADFGREKKGGQSC